MRNQRGITLVALVVTIIVLLILAGVSLSLVMGNQGILNQATTAVETDKVAKAKEEVELLVAEETTEFYKEVYVDNITDYNTNVLTHMLGGTNKTYDCTTKSGYVVTFDSRGITGENKQGTISIKESSSASSAFVTGKITVDGAITWD